MKRALLALLVVVLAGVGARPALSQLIPDVFMYVDSAPNVYGSPNWAPWWAQTKTDIVANNFTDMRTGNYPGTHTMNPYDEIVYDYGDLGKRLHWMYWMPGVSTEDLNDLFQVKWVIDWGGENWTYDWVTHDWALDGAEAGWVQPGSWEDYSGGVIGTFGFAWDGSGQYDLGPLVSEVNQNQTFARGIVRYRQSAGGGGDFAGLDEWQYKDLKVDMVPEPGSLVLMGAGLLGAMSLIAIRRKTRH